MFLKNQFILANFCNDGIFGDYQFLYDKNLEADFYVVGNWTKKENILKNKNTIFLQQEPPEVKFLTKQS